MLASLFATATHAETEDCECLWQGPFVDVQAETDLVISGSVSRVRGNAVDLNVERVLRGQLPDAALDVEALRVRLEAQPAMAGPADCLCAGAVGREGGGQDVRELGRLLVVELAEELQRILATLSPGTDRRWHRRHLRRLRGDFPRKRRPRQELCQDHPGRL